MKLKIEQVVEKLIQTGYNEEHAQSLGEELVNSDIIREPLTHWVETGEEVDCAYEEITAFELMQNRSFTYPNALNVISWLYSEPKVAREALSSGVDSIVWEGWL